MALFDEVKKQLDACVCDNTEDIVPENGDTFFGLPKPYSVPTPGDCFHEMYYWDTYFTNVGFLEVGNVTQAKNNTEDIMALIHRFGFMPNGSRKRYMGNTQPPFFAQMVQEVYEKDNDKDFLERAYVALTKEYDFFTKNRTFENGLAHYGFLPTDEEFINSRIGHWTRRTGLPADKDPVLEVGNYISYCESGWDCNPRWENHGYLYAAPDINSLLWNLETKMLKFSLILGKGEEKLWSERADARKKRMNEYLWDEKRGCFLDRRTDTGKFSDVFSAASFYPLYFGLATKEQAEKTLKNLPLLEYDNGIGSCEKTDSPASFQWGYSNAWPCMQWIVVKALLNYGFEKDALRVAKKYIDCIENAEKKTGQLWEKYNAQTGMTDGAAEYATPPMMGWTAGVYLKLKRVLGEN